MFYAFTNLFASSVPCVKRISYVLCSGLSHSEVAKLDSFLHFSKPKNLKKKSILEMGELNPALDFLDVLSDDIPKGEDTVLDLPYTKTCSLFFHLHITRMISHFTGLDASMSVPEHPSQPPPFFI